LLYDLLKIPAKLALLIYCRSVQINDRSWLQHEGPLLIACNHPNSFLDAIILSTLFRKPVYSLARGDAFGKPFYAKLLRSLNMFPVYRVSEGVENLDHNYKTFDDCKELFKRNGIVLIFSEGRCINEWHLRPLKKGTARLAISSWQDGIPLTVLPAGINYSSFHTFGKNMQIRFGQLITREDVILDGTYGRSVVMFNNNLGNQLKELVIEKDASDKEGIRNTFEVKVPLLKKILLAVPAAAGWLVHAPLFFPIKKLTWPRTKHNDHYDSVIVGLLFLLYPVYLLLITGVAVWLTGSHWCWLLLIVLPFCARSYVQLKHQFD